MDSGFFTDGREPTSKDDSENTKGAALFFFVVRVKPIRMIWSMSVQCKCAEDQAAITEHGRVVEQAWLPGVDCQIKQ